MRMTLSDRLVHARKASGYDKVKPAAEAAGITPSALYQLEGGTSRSLSGDTAEKLARVYAGFRIEWLISGTGPERDPALQDTRGTYAASQSLRIDPETIASALRLIRLSFANLDLEFDSEEDGVPLAYAYEYLHARGERIVTPDNLVDFSKRLAERLRENTDGRAGEQGGDTGSVGGSDRLTGEGRKAG